VHAPVRACAGGKQRVVPDVVVKKVESGFYQGQAGAFAARKFAAGEVLFFFCGAQVCRRRGALFFLRRASLPPARCSLHKTSKPNLYLHVSVYTTAISNVRASLRLVRCPRTLPYHPTLPVQVCRSCGAARLLLACYIPVYVPLLSLCQSVPALVYVG